jgi:transcriptional regulator with XRE-family HTH domain
MSTKTDTTSQIIDGQAEDAKVAFGRRLREKINDLGIPDAQVARRAGISTSALSSYTKGRSFPNSEQLFPLCDVLGVEARWLISGATPNPANLIAVEDADWEDIPFFDLRNVSDTGKGDPQSWTPFRKDWLNNALGTAFDLYLVRLLSDYHDRNGDRALHEGQLVFVREVTPAELSDGNVVIWRREGGLKIARYALQRRDRDEGDLILPEEVSDDKFVPVCRIYGKYLQRI